MEESDEHSKMEFAEKPDTSVLSIDDRESVNMALQMLRTLPEGERQILMLRELDGLRYEEISSQIECSLDAVKSRLRRARIHLQEKARHFLKSHAFSTREHL